MKETAADPEPTQETLTHAILLNAWCLSNDAHQRCLTPLTVRSDDLAVRISNTAELLVVEAVRKAILIILKGQITGGQNQIDLQIVRRVGPRSEDIRKRKKVPINNPKTILSELELVRNLLAQELEKVQRMCGIR